MHFFATSGIFFLILFSQVTLNFIRMVSGEYCTNILDTTHRKEKFQTKNLQSEVKNNFFWNDLSDQDLLKMGSQEHEECENAHKSVSMNDIFKESAFFKDKSSESKGQYDRTKSFTRSKRTTDLYKPEQLGNEIQNQLKTFISNSSLIDVCAMLICKKVASANVKEALASSEYSQAGKYSWRTRNFSGVERISLYDALMSLSPETMHQGFYGTIQRRFKRAGLETCVQVNQDGVRNVVGIIPGTEKKEVLVIGGKWTGNHGCKGLDDNGSGLTVMVKLVDELFRYNIKPEATIIFVAYSNFGKHEIFHGSDVFIKEFLIPNYIKNGYNMLGAYTLDRVLNSKSRKRGRNFTSLLKYAPDLLKLLTSDLREEFLLAIGRTGKDQTLTETLVDNFNRLTNNFPSKAYALKIHGNLKDGLRNHGSYFYQSDHCSFWKHGLPSAHIYDAGIRLGQIRTARSADGIECNVDDCDLDRLKRLTDAFFLSVVDITKGRIKSTNLTKIPDHLQQKKKKIENSANEQREEKELEIITEGNIPRSNFKPVQRTESSASKSEKTETSTKRNPSQSYLISDDETDSSTHQTRLFEASTQLSSLNYDERTYAITRQNEKLETLTEEGTPVPNFNYVPITEYFILSTPTISSSSSSTTNTATITTTTTTLRADVTEFEEEGTHTHTPEIPQDLILKESESVFDDEFYTATEPIVPFTIPGSSTQSHDLLPNVGPSPFVSQATVTDNPVSQMPTPYSISNNNSIERKHQLNMSSINNTAANFNYEPTEDGIKGINKYTTTSINDTRSIGCDSITTKKPSKTLITTESTSGTQTGKTYDITTTKSPHSKLTTRQIRSKQTIPSQTKTKPESKITAKRERTITEKEKVQSKETRPHNITEMKNVHPTMSLKFINATDQKTDEPKERLKYNDIKVNEKLSPKTVKLNISSLESDFQKLRPYSDRHRGPKSVDNEFYKEAIQMFNDVNLPSHIQKETYEEHGDQSRRRDVINVIARIEGQRFRTEEDHILLVGAHYDTPEGCPGVDVNGSGMILLFQVANALVSSGFKFLNTIYFVVFDAGSQDYAGSAMFIHRHLNNHVIDSYGSQFLGAFILNGLLNFNTSVGSQLIDRSWEQDNGDIVNLIETEDNKGDFVSVVYRKGSDDLLAHTLKDSWNNLNDNKTQMKLLNAGSNIRYWKEKRIENEFTKGDHLVFWRSGDYKAVAVTDTGRNRKRMNECYHKSCDNFDFVTPENLLFMKKVGEALIATIITLAEEYTGKD